MARPCTTPGCEAIIDWAVTEAGAPMPIDRDSAGKSGGNLAVWRDGRVLRCRALSKGEQPRDGEKWGTNHWGTCTKADEHRRKAGWFHNKAHRRWEYRAVDGGPPVDWYHEVFVFGYPEAVAAKIADKGYPPLPPEARPAPERNPS